MRRDDRFRATGSRRREKGFSQSVNLLKHLLNHAGGLITFVSSIYSPEMLKIRTISISKIPLTICGFENYLNRTKAN